MFEILVQTERFASRDNLTKTKEIVIKIEKTAQISVRAGALLFWSY